MLGSQRRLTRRYGTIASALALAACGLSAGSAAGHPTPSAAVSASPTPWPPGGPVPAALAGLWYFDAIPSQVTLSGTDYKVEQPKNMAHGNVVVSGDEIDFFNGNGCGEQLPGGVGRYRWQLQGTSVHFTPLNSDPCGRVEILANQTWSRTTTLH